MGCNRCRECKPNDVGEQSGAQYFLYHRCRCRRNCRAFACRPSLKVNTQKRAVRVVTESIEFIGRMKAKRTRQVSPKPGGLDLFLSTSVLEEPKILTDDKVSQALRPLVLFQRHYSKLILFPLDGSRRLAGDVIGDPVDAADLVDDPGRDSPQEFMV